VGGTRMKCGQSEFAIKVKSKNEQIFGCGRVATGLFLTVRER